MTPADIARIKRAAAKNQWRRETPVKDGLTYHQRDALKARQRRAARALAAGRIPGRCGPVPKRRTRAMVWRGRIRARRLGRFVLDALQTDAIVRPTPKETKP